MFEKKTEPLAGRNVFVLRMLQHGLIAAAIISGSLAIGVIGYHAFEGLPWLDALLNASMILGSMGPVDPIRTTAGKLFASLYALYAGLVFVVVAGILLLPAVHRLLHHFHWSDEEDSEDQRADQKKSAA